MEEPQARQRPGQSEPERPREGHHTERAREGHHMERPRQAHQAAFVEKFADRIFRFLRAMTGDEEMARDATQETMLRIIRAFPPGSAEMPGASYVFAAARNTAVSLVRRRRLEERHRSLASSEDLDSSGAPGPGPDREFERRELRAALSKALLAIPEKLRTVFLLSEIEGLSYSEIGQAVRCSPGTVASRKHHAVRRLRRLMRSKGFAL